MRAWQWMFLFATSCVFAGQVNLSQLQDDYIAQSGDTLTDTLSKSFSLSIADSAVVTFSNVVIPDSCGGVRCEGNCTIFLDGTNIVKASQSHYPGICVPKGGNLVIDGEGALDVDATDVFAAGIGGCFDGTVLGYYKPDGNIEIRNGTIVAKGGYSSAGIGSSSMNECGNIVISGGSVTAIGGSSAAGIGCGSGGKCGDITITSGVKNVTSVKGGTAASAIGLGDIGLKGKITIDGAEIEKVTDSIFTFVPENFYTLVFEKNHDGVTGAMENQKMLLNATSKLKKNSFVYKGWTFAGWNTVANGSGTSYVDQAEVENLVDKKGTTVKLYAQWKENNDLANASVEDVRSYYVFDGKTPISVKYAVTALDGNSLKEGTDYEVAFTKGGKKMESGVIASAGDYALTVSGIGDYKGSRTINFTVGAGKLVDLSLLTDDYTAQSADILTGKLGGTHKISIAAGATVMLKNAVIDIVDEKNCDWGKPSWSGLTCEGDCSIFLVDSNVVKGYCRVNSGIFVPQGSTLTIDGKGSLEAVAAGWGAGIGGCDKNPKSGNITILDGTIKAQGSLGAAGIGCGYNGECGDITIRGGTVTAYSSDMAVGIGGGYQGKIGTIAISGGAVVAEGIGGGDLSTNVSIAISGGSVLSKGIIGCRPDVHYNGYGTICSVVSISGGTVVAESGNPAIGGGRGGVIISGGDVTAIGSAYQGVGISSEDSVVISGGKVTAVGGRDAPGIGAAGREASEYRTFGDIIISGGTVKSTGGMYSSGLGSGIYSHGGDIIITPDVVMVYVDVEYADDSPYSVGTASRSSTLGKLIVGGEEWKYRTEKPFIYYGRGYKDTVNVDSGRVDIGRNNGRYRSPGENVFGVVLKKTYNAMGRVVDGERKVRGAYYRKKILAR